MKNRKILITPTIAVALLFLMALLISVQATESVKENENKIEELSSLTYENWKGMQEKEINKLEAKMSKMTEKRFNKMIEMQKLFSEGEIAEAEILKKELNFFS